MAEIYVPIESSDLRSRIPPDEQIIYSTMLHGSITFGNRRTTWNTHALMTNKGIHSYMARALQKQLDYHFMDWIYVKRIGGGTIMFNLNDTYSFARVDQFETKEDFKVRKKNMGATLYPVILNRCQNWLNENSNNPDVKGRLLKGVQKRLAKAQKSVAKFNK